MEVLDNQNLVQAGYGLFDSHHKHVFVDLVDV